jgi:hypothetical protein
MAQLSTVAEYLAESRRLLQDATAPYRYPDVDLVEALNFGLMEMRRLRPDLFLNEFTVPSYVSTTPTAVVTVDLMYRTPLVYYMVGRMQLRDDEATMDARAGTFMQKFLQQLVAIA